MNNQTGYSVKLNKVSYKPNIFGDRGVLNNISIDILGGEFVSIIGRNGHGKTSIMRAIAGEIDNLFGEVYVNGILINKPINSLISGVGFVHQFVQYDLIKELSIEKNIQIRQLLGNEKFRNIDFTDDRWVAHINKELAQVMGSNNVYPTIDYLVDYLSGGQRQLLNVYIALKLEHIKNEFCKLLLLDEHLSSLDYVISRKVMTLIEELCPLSNGKRSTTIIMVTHDFECALKYSDKIIILKDGEVKEIVNRTDAKANWNEGYLINSIEV